MKKSIKNDPHEAEDMNEDFDFSKAVKSQHYKSYRQGHTVQIEKDDGTVEIRYFGPSNGFVVLDPDLRKHFRTPKAVNKALRELIAKR